MMTELRRLILFEGRLDKLTDAEVARARLVPLFSRR
jgi:hypothetical protein